MNKLLTLFSGKDFLNSLLNSTVDAIIVCDFTGSIMAVSPACAELLDAAGFDEIKGKSVLGFIAGETKTAALADLRKIAESRSEVILEYELVTLKNRSIFTEISVTVLRDDKNDPLAFLANIRNITKRRKELLLTKALYEISAAAHSSDSFFNLSVKIHNILNDILPAKNLFIALHNKEEKTLTFPYFVDEFDSGAKIIKAKSRKTKKGLTEYILQKGKTVCLEREDIYGLKEKGEIELLGAMPFQWLGTPLKSAEGSIIGILAVQTYNENERYDQSDEEFITFVSSQIGLVIEKQVSEDKRKKTEEQFRAVFEDTGVGIILLNREGKFVKANPVFTELTGYEESELFDKSYTELTMPEDAVKSLERFRKIFAEKTDTYKIEHQYIKKSGQSFWGKVTVSRMEGENEEPLVLAVIEDVTVRKEFEKKLTRQRNMFNGIAEASKTLLVEKDFNKAVSAAFRFVGSATGASRVTFFRDIKDEDDTGHYLEYLYEWTARGVAPWKDNYPELFFSDVTLEWHKKLSAGEEVLVKKKDLPPQSPMNTANIDSILLIPVFVNDQYWGHLNFEICNYNYERDEEEITILNTLASSLGAMIERNSYLERINESERKFRLISESSRDLIGMHNEEATFEYASPSSVSLLGFEPEELTGKTPWFLIHPEDVDLIKTRFFNAVTFEKDYIQFDYRFRHKEGHYLWVETILNIIRDKRKKILGLQSATRDIQDRKEAEDSLRKSELRFRMIWENSRDGMRLLDENGIVVQVNDAFCELVEKEKANITGCYFSDIYRDEKSSELLEHYRERVSGHEVHTTLERHITLWNGKKKWFQVSNSELKLNDDKKLVLSIFRDITERKLAEEKITRYAEELKRLNVNKDKFFSLISHDLKSPFTALLGYTDILSADMEMLSRDEIAEIAKNIDSTSKGLYGLLENLLNWSRIQTGRLEFYPEVVDLKDIFRNVKTLFKDLADSKRISLKLELPEKANAYADRNIVYTVVRNLTSNALKYSYPGDQVLLRAEQEDGFFRVSVIDNGEGMKPELVEKILNSENMNSTQGTDNEQGTGLGLYLCRELLLKGESELEIKSSPGSGSAMSFKAPVHTT